MKSTFQHTAIIRPALILFVLIALASCSKKPSYVGFAFYNVENLFDTIDDPNTNDNSYLPDSDIPWNTERYITKLDHLTRVMSSIDTIAGYPALFGLSEVENFQVLKDLANHPGLRDAKYQIIHRDSPDERGIDVALLYRPSVFTPLTYRFIPVIFPFDTGGKTRDILYAKGVVQDSDTLHIFINHWTSRWGGREETDGKRRFTGALLKQITDSIFGQMPGANILIAGDLNDNPDDHSVVTDLGALPVTGNALPGKLYNLSLAGYREGNGTLFYKSWDMFDQIIVSGNLLNPSGTLHVTSPDQEIIGHDWMLFQPAKGPARPNRTASGSYYGGYSDHLPVFIRMRSE